MFAEDCRKAARDYPYVAFEEAMIDTFSMKLVYDVMVTGIHFGDILWLGRKRGEPRATAAASHIQAAVDQIVAEANLARDLGGKARSREMGNAIAATVLK
ncbi:MAG TPA: hypothetical protein VGJ20_29260 [Xanthobacteraceae bacterium]|jgi:isocitrate/isopropylmalate dehydrogenase